MTDTPLSRLKRIPNMHDRGRPGPEGKHSQSKDVLTLKQLEQDWLGAYREGDADKMGKILADDFIGRWADGSTQTT